MKKRIISLLIAAALAMTGNIGIPVLAEDSLHAAVTGDCIVNNTIAVDTNASGSASYEWYIADSLEGEYVKLKSADESVLNIMPWYAARWVKARVSDGEKDVWTEPVQEKSKRTILNSGGASAAVGARQYNFPNSCSSGYVSVELEYKKEAGSGAGCAFMFLDTDRNNYVANKTTFWGGSLLSELDGKTLMSGADDGVWHTLNFSIDLSKNPKLMKVYIDNGATLKSDVSTYQSSEMGGLMADLSGVGFEYKNLSISHVRLPSTPPAAEHVKINGSLAVNMPLTVDYTYVDEDNDGGGEGAAKFLWYASDRINGDYGIIPGETAGQFVPTALFAGRYVKCGVTPRDLNDSVGKETLSDAVLISDEKTEIVREEFEGGTISNAEMISKNELVDLSDGTAVLKDGGILSCTADSIAQRRYVFRFDLKKNSGAAAVDLGDGKSLRLDYDNSRIIYDGNAVDCTFDPEISVACEVDFINNRVKFAVDGTTFLAGDLKTAAPKLTVSNEGDPARLDNLLIYATPNVGNVPVVSNVVITGSGKVGNTLSVSYDYYDEDGDADAYSVIKWYLSDNGSWELIQQGRNLKITEDMAGKYIKASVIPVDSRSAVGEEVSSGEVLVSTSISVIFDEGFESFSLGKDGWKKEMGDGTAERRDGALYYQNTTGSNFMLSKTFSVGDADSVRYDVALKCPSGITAGTLYYTVRSQQGTTFAIVFSDGRISLLARNSKADAGATGYAIGEIETGKTYRFTFQINLSSQTFDAYLDGALLKERFGFAEGYNKQFSAPVMVYIDTSVKNAELVIEDHKMQKLTASEMHTTLNYKDITYYANGIKQDQTAVAAAGDKVSAKVQLENFEGADKNVVITLAAYQNGALVNLDSRKYAVPNETNYRSYDSPELVAAGGETFRCFVWRENLDNLKLVNTTEVYEEETVTGEWSVRVDKEIDTNTFTVRGACAYTPDGTAAVLVKDQNGGILHLDTAPLDKDGRFSFTFTPESGVSGKISICAGLMNMSRVTYDECSKLEAFSETVFGQAEVKAALSAINSAETVNELKNLIDQYTGQKVLLRGEIGNTYRACAEEAIGYLLQARPAAGYDKLYTVDQELSAIAAAIAIRDSADRCGAIEKYIDLLNLEKDPKYEVIKKSVDVIYNKLTENNLPKTYQAFSETVRTAQAITMINFSGAGEMEELFKRYQDVLLLNLNGDYSSVNKTDVGKLLVGKNFKSVAEIKNAFDAAVSRVKGFSGQGGGTGGGGTGGGSSGGSGKSSGRYDVIIPVTNEQTTATAKFLDVDQSRYSSKAIEHLASLSVLSGYEDGNFYPEKAVTREEFAAMIVRVMKYAKQDQPQTFLDVQPGAWYCDAVEILSSNGIIKGIGEGLFGVGMPITREDMAAIIYRCLEKRGVIEKERPAAEFEDASEISGYAKQAIDELYQGNILNGYDNRFAPKDQATREQVAVILYRMLGNQ